jgi:hypothetical protein
MSRNTYSVISDFGSNAYSAVNNPLSYAIPDQNMDQKFLHGSSSIPWNGQHSKHSQLYMSQYCADKWDGFCEVASKNANTSYPNQVATCDSGCIGVTAGDALIRNTAAEKYLKSMGNCERKYEPFDPTVATSPMISHWENETCSNSKACIPVYAVNPKTIDADPVMSKILDKPQVAPMILLNIFNTMGREGTLKQLHGTKLGHFYTNNPFFKSRGGLEHK